MTGYGTADTAQLAIAHEHGQRALDALDHLEAFMARAARLVARGRVWYDSDPDQVARLACEALIIKVGHAASRVPQPLRSQYPDIPWTVMSDMRNQFAHGYDVTDYSIVWDTLINDFPGVHERIRGILGYE